MNYRVKQFIWAVTSSVKKIDNNILNKYLTEREKELFNTLSHADKHHSIRVCKDALALAENIKNIDKVKLAKVALLHDTGKGNNSLNAIEKSILVIFHKISGGKLKEYTSYKKVDAYYNHPKRGLKILSNEKKYDEEFLEVVEKHHHKEIGNNIYLKLVKESDDKN